MKRNILSLLLAVVLCISLAVTAFAATGTDAVLDEAGLLDRSERDELNRVLQEMGAQTDTQLIVATVSETPGGDPDRFIEYFYDSLELGYGEEHNGVLLMVCMDLREYRILSNGLAAAAIGGDEIDAISDAVVSYLSDGDYAEAFEEFGQQCRYYIDGYVNGFPFRFGKNLLIALIVGLVVGLIVAFALKAQLKSVRRQDQADAYVKPGSMQITRSSDYFLYRNVTRTKKESGGSSRGSGSSRNVGGGSF